MRTENLGKDIYEDEIWIKLARDTNLEQMFSGGYYRTADYENFPPTRTAFPREI
jgi:hypothetical protein